MGLCVSLYRQVKREHDDPRQKILKQGPLGQSLWNRPIAPKLCAKRSPAKQPITARRNKLFTKFATDLMHSASVAFSIAWELAERRGRGSRPTSGDPSVCRIHRMKCLPSWPLADDIGSTSGKRAKQKELVENAGPSTPEEAFSWP